METTITHTKKRRQTLNSNIFLAAHAAAALSRCGYSVLVIVSNNDGADEELFVEEVTRELGELMTPGEFFDPSHHGKVQLGYKREPGWDWILELGSLTSKTWDYPNVPRKLNASSTFILNLEGI